MQSEQNKNEEKVAAPVIVIDSLSMFETERVFHALSEIKEAEQAEIDAVKVCDDVEVQWQQARIIALRNSLTGKPVGNNERKAGLLLSNLFDLQPSKLLEQPPLTDEEREYLDAAIECDKNGDFSGMTLNAMRVPGFVSHLVTKGLVVPPSIIKSDIVGKVASEHGVVLPQPEFMLDSEAPLERE